MYIHPGILYKAAQDQITEDEGLHKDHVMQLVEMRDKSADLKLQLCKLQCEIESMEKLTAACNANRIKSYNRERRLEKRYGWLARPQAEVQY
mgnify:CR=1 FL=1